MPIFAAIQPQSHGSVTAFRYEGKAKRPMCGGGPWTGAGMDQAGDVTTREVFPMAEVEATTFEKLLNDPMVRLVMRADGVDTADMLATLCHVRDAIVARGRAPLSRSARTAGGPVLVATSGRA